MATKNNGSRRNKRKAIHNRHERWCVDVALRICGEVTKHVVFRQYLTVDACIRIDIPALWVGLGKHLVERDVYVEHFSDSVSTVNYASAAQKIAYALRVHESIPLKNRRGKKAPCMVVLSHRRPDRLLREKDLFRQTGTPGILIAGPQELGAMYLVIATQLPADPAYDWLRSATRLPDTPEGFRDAVDLMNEQNLDTTKREELEATIMNVFIEGMTPIEVMEKLRASEEAKHELAKQLLLEREMNRIAMERVLAETRSEQEKFAAELSAIREELSQLRGAKSESEE